MIMSLSTTNGIFGPGGFLAKLNEQEEDQLQLSFLTEIPKESENDVAGGNSVTTTESVPEPAQTMSQQTTAIIAPIATTSTDTETNHSSECAHYSNSNPKKRKLCDPEEESSVTGVNVNLAQVSNANHDDEEDGDPPNSFEPSAVQESDLKSSDISPEEAAFAIDHILESILSYIPRHLPKTRLVSHRFNTISSKLLEKYLRIIISIPGEFEISIKHYDEISISTSLGLRRIVKSLDDLTSVLSDSKNKFPCTSFILITENLKEPRIQNLLHVYGPYIKTLDLNPVYMRSSITDDVILAELKALLVEQVPNLRNLEINISTPMPIIQNQDQQEENVEIEEEEAVPESHNNSQDKTNHDENDDNFCLPNLKSLDIQECSFGIFEKLMDAALNLQNYDGHQEEYLHYFINGPGVGRLQLLKHVSICITPLEINLERLEAIANLMETKDCLEIQILHLSCICLVKSPELWRRASSVINRILKGSAPSLQILYWESVRFLHGIQIPVMPQVETLFLAGASPKVIELCSEDEKGFFPVGFDMAKIFPNLKIIIILSQAKIPDISLGDLLDLNSYSNNMNNSNLKPVQSVTSVRFNNSVEVFTEERHLFNRAFPNANVTSVSESDSDSD